MMDDEPSPWADAPSSPPPPPRTLSPASIRKSLEIAPPPPTSSHIKHSSPLADDSFDSFDEPAPTNGAGGDDDDGFGQHAAADEDDGFDDFDDPAPVGENGGDDGFGGDDDFGDFGDFEEDGGAGFEEEEEEGGELDRRQETTYASPPPPQAAPTYPPLHLSPFPDAQTLSSTVQSLLGPIFPNLDADSQMGPEDVRQVPGLGQVLVDEESRKLYKSLTIAPPLARLDWTRSRVRREHLITLGVPVNLDEVASTKPPSLPTLRISTLVAQSPSHPSPHASSPTARPTSTPPAPRPNAPKRSNTITGSSSSTTRWVMAVSASASGATTPKGSGPKGDVAVGKKRDETYGLGRKPEVDWESVEAALAIPTDALPLKSLPELSLLHSKLEDSTASASVLLSYLLQLKDAQQHESLISNGLIGELVGRQMRAAMSAGKGNR